MDLNYTGPDDGEGNGMPDFREGIGCEPNFAVTDISESDMIGLTAYRMFIHPGYTYAGLDRELWDIFAVDSVAEYLGSPSNLIQMFGSGRFPLYKGRTERYSISHVHTYEDLAGLSSPQHKAPSLFAKKIVVQGIYESDYRFAQPPLTPTLSARVGDGRVYLSWDDAADRLTREPMLRGANDFEGYKLYRSTDRYFADAEVIFDGYGNPAGKKPVFQCDLKDGRSGFADFAVFNGLAFYLGDDSGVQHYFIDENVQNGRTYYYALVAYDYGIAEFGIEKATVPPSENEAVIELDEAEEIRFVGKNVKVVTPHQPAVGYAGPSFPLEGGAEVVRRSGAIEPVVFSGSGLKVGHRYKVKFDAVTLGNLRSSTFRHRSDRLFTTTGFSVYDVGEGDVLVYREVADTSQGDNIQFGEIVGAGNPNWHFNEDGLESDVFDGLQLLIRPRTLLARLDEERTGWAVPASGGRGIRVTASVNESRFFPWDYEIRFSDQTYRGRTTVPIQVTSLDGRPVAGTRLLLGETFNYRVINTTYGDTLDLVVQDVDSSGQYDADSDYVLAGHVVTVGGNVRWAGTVLGIDFQGGTGQMPRSGDVYRVEFVRPYLETDSVLFRVQGEVEAVAGEIRAGMGKIKVVPNPYVGTNVMEPALSNPYLNQRRRLLFTHIPASCEITIFTMSGVVVDGLTVENVPEDGTVHWDMLTREGLEIAAGVYIYHVKAKETGDEFIGKFAVIK
jgi:hypothetical protein